MSKRVILGEYLHETNSFVNLPTALDAYQGGDLLYGTDIIDYFGGKETSLGGFLEVGIEQGWQLVPTVAARSMPAGNVTADCYATLKGKMLDRIQKALAGGPVDGVLLALHGALVVDGIDDGDGDLLTAMRALVGKNIPLICTLDLHANVSDAMATAADGIFLYKTYPHVDRAENAARAARVLDKTMKGEVEPVMAICRPPFLPPLLGHFTGQEPMQSILAGVRRLEEQSCFLNASVACGFPYTDVYEAGFCAVVVADGDQPRAQAAANTVALEAWRRREDFDLQLPLPEEAFAEAARASQTPVVLADPGDNTGAGAPGNDTSILQRVLEAGLAPAAFAVWWNPSLVTEALAAGPGGIVTVMLNSTRNGARPMKVLAGVRSLSEGSFTHKGPNGRGMVSRLGRSAVLTILAAGAAGDDLPVPAQPWATGKPAVDVMVSTRRWQPLDAEVFRSHGLEPTDYRALVLKSSVHFRADFTPMAAGGILTMDTEGPAAPNPRRFPFRKVRRPIFPLDTAVDWEPGQHDDGTIPVT